MRMLGTPYWGSRHRDGRMRCVAASWPSNLLSRSEQVMLSPTDTPPWRFQLPWAGPGRPVPAEAAGERRGAGLTSGCSQHPRGYSPLSGRGEGLHLLIRRYQSSIRRPGTAEGRQEQQEQRTFHHAFPRKPGRDPEGPRVWTHCSHARRPCRHQLPC